MYLWDEGGVELSAYHLKQSDGTPQDSYITSISGNQPVGSLIPADKFTGENYVTVTVSTTNGLRGYQLGIKTDKACNIKISVDRTGNYEVDTSIQEITLGSNDNKRYTLPQNGTTTALRLVNVNQGTYALTVKPFSAGARPQAGVMSAYILSSERSLLWSDDSYKGILRIKDSCEYIYIVNNGPNSEFYITLEQYETPAIKEVNNSLPAISNMTNLFAVDPFELSLDDSVDGVYYFKVTSDVPNAILTETYLKKLTVNINGESTEYRPSDYNNAGSIYEIYITLKRGDKLQLSINDNDYAIFVLKVYIESLSYFSPGESFTLTPPNSASNIYNYAFSADEAGQYKINFKMKNQPTSFLDSIREASLMIFDVVSGEQINFNYPESEASKRMKQEGYITFELSGDDLIILKIQISAYIKCDVECTFEKVS